MTSTIAPGNALDKNAFLQLMVTQMQYQDPLAPQDNSQFLAQLAQFSSLEQMTNAAQADTSILQAITSLQQMTQLAFEHQLIGTQAEVTDASGNAVQGTVSAIQFVKGDPQLVIDGQTYPLAALNKMG